MRYILVLLTLITFRAQAADNYGHFVGELKVRWLPDGRSMELLEKFSYVGPDNRKWTAKKGAIVNGASIPRILWTLVGPPFVGMYRRASVVHDYYCDVKTERWEDVHLMFYHACLAGGTNETRAKVMYLTVYLLGPRWEDPTIEMAVFGRRRFRKTSSSRVRVSREPASTHATNVRPPDVPDEIILELKEWVENENPSIQEIHERLMVFDLVVP